MFIFVTFEVDKIHLTEVNSTAEIGTAESWSTKLLEYIGRGQNLRSYGRRER